MKILRPGINGNNNNNNNKNIEQLDNSYQAFKDLTDNSNINVNSHAFTVCQFEFEFEARTTEKMYQWRNKLFRYFKCNVQHCLEHIFRLKIKQVT